MNAMSKPKMRVVRPLQIRTAALILGLIGGAIGVGLVGLWVDTRTSSPPPGVSVCPTPGYFGQRPIVVGDSDVCSATDVGSKPIPSQASLMCATDLSRLEGKRVEIQVLYGTRLVRFHSFSSEEQIGYWVIERSDITAQRGSGLPPGRYRCRFLVSGQVILDRAFTIVAAPRRQRPGSEVTAPAGLIAYESLDGLIHAVNADGTGEHQLTRPHAGDAYDSDPSWSPDGTMLAFSRVWIPGSQIVVVNANGGQLHPLTHGIHASDPAWSPDGKRIAFAGESGIYVIGTDGRGLRQVVHVAGDPEEGGGPTWSPDGTKLAYASNDTGSYQIYVVNSDGSGLRRLTGDEENRDPAFLPTYEGRLRLKRLTSDEENRDPAWSPDGSRIAFTRDNGSDFVGEIYVMNADGSSPRNLSGSRTTDSAPTWSPDGTMIAFVHEIPAGPGLFTEDLWLWYLDAMNADGSSARTLSSISLSSLSWSRQPLARAVEAPLR